MRKHTSEKPTYLDPGRPINKRVDDLLRRMTPVATTRHNKGEGNAETCAIYSMTSPKNGAGRNEETDSADNDREPKENI